MNTQHIIYLTTMVVSLVLSILCAKSHKSLYIISYAIGLAILAESIANIHFYMAGKFSWYFLYHVYIPVEYALITSFFSRNITNQKLQFTIKLSVIAFVLCSVYLSLIVIGIDKFPGHTYNLEGVLLCMWAIIILLNIEPNINYSIIQLPLFWICLGTLVFHSGIFIINGIYNTFSTNHTALFLTLRGLIEKNLNIFQYLSYCIAFICSHRIMKS